MNSTRFGFCLVNCIVLAAMSARAADGTTDIRPTGTATFTISTPGSYVLVGDVNMADSSLNCIVVTTDNVSINLNGHTITGLSGSGRGVDAPNRVRITITGGNIVTFGGGGVRCGPRARISNLLVDSCGPGVAVGDASIVRDLIVRSCRYSGISAGNYCLIESCNVSLTGATDGLVFGISAGDHAVIRNNIASNNSSTSPIHGGTGIFTGDYANISGNVAASNSGMGSGHGYGIQVGAACTLSGNTAVANTGGATGNGYGISTGGSSVIINNVCSSNAPGNTSGTGIGINGGNFDRIDGNTCDFNHSNLGNGSGVGIQAPSHCRVTNNSCTDNDATGSGIARGIEVQSSCVVQDNHCAGNSGGAGSSGIRVIGGANTIRANTTTGSATAGILLTAGGNYLELNRMDEAGGISGGAGNTLAAGELQNVIY